MTSSTKKYKNRWIWQIALIFVVLFATNVYVGFQDESMPEEIVYTPYDGYPYLLYLPQDYDVDPYKKWPVIIYLHGASLRGNDTALLKRYGLPYLIDRGEQYEFIIASPQCPAGKSWNTDNWFPTFYNYLTAHYRLDTSRIYLTGMSLGGYGTWHLGAEYPERFAAIAPLCGGGNPGNAENYRDVAVMAVHGTKDEIVPINRSKVMVEALREDDQKVKFVKLHGEGHAIQDFYEEKKLYRWFLKHEK